VAVPCAGESTTVQRWIDATAAPTNQVTRSRDDTMPDHVTDNEQFSAEIHSN
jgi:hypothetical protein